MISETRTLKSGLALIALAVLLILIGARIDFIGEMLGKFLDKCVKTAYGPEAGKHNIIIAYLLLAVLPFAPFILVRLKPVTLIAVIIAIFPLFGRIKSIGIFAYTNFMWQEELISGIALFGPILLFYLLIYHPPPQYLWRLPSSKGFYLLTVSAIAMQFFHFSPVNSIIIGYLIIGFQLIWYLMIIFYVNTKEDVYKILWGIVVAVMISTVLTILTTGINPNMLYAPHAYFRVTSNSLGGYNEYSIVLSSTLCLLPLLAFRRGMVNKLIIGFAAPLIFMMMIFTGTRGSYLSILAFAFYIFLLKDRPLYLLFILFFAMVTIYVFLDKIILYMIMRPIYFDDQLFKITSVHSRLDTWEVTLNTLLSWPEIFTGYGMGTLETWYTIPTYYGHDPHNGFLWIWVNSGVLGLTGFCLWIGSTIWAALKKAISKIVFEDRMLLLGLIAAILNWMINFALSKGCYTGSPWQEVYALLTTEVGLLVVLTQKPLLSNKQ